MSFSNIYFNKMFENCVIFLRFISMKETLKAIEDGILDNVKKVEDEQKVEIKLEGSVREEYERDYCHNRFTIAVHGTIINYYTSGTPNNKLRCKFCRSNIPKNNIPVHLPEKIIREKRVIKGKKITVYTSKGSLFHCDFNCALGTVLENPFRYGKYEQNLRLIHRVSCKNQEILQPAEHPELLKINGGDMDYEEYKKERVERFHKSEGLIMENSRVCYGKY